MARGDEFSVVYVDGDVPQRPIQLGQLLVDSSQIAPGVTGLLQCTEQTDPAVYEPLQGGYPETSAERTAGVTIVNYLYPPLNVLRYGTNTVPGTTDMTAAFEAAIAVSTAQYNATVWVPNGYYLITDEIIIPQGTMIVAPGSQGSTAGFGTTILHASNGNLFTWNGSGTAARGTGGGIKNFLLLKQTGFSGGYALNIVGIDDNHRPGEMMLVNILAYGTGTGLWARGLNVDGSACTTPSSKGVRSVVGFKLRFVDCTDTLRNISLNQAVHCTLVHAQVDQGDGPVPCGITVEGDAENVALIALECNGELEINSATTRIAVVGRVSTLDVNYASADGTYSGGAATITNASPSFKISSSAASAFLAVRTSDVADVTGDGTVYTVLFDNDSTSGAFDVAGNYDPSTGIFTCTQAGIYQVHTRVTWLELGALHDKGALGIERRDSGGTLLQYAYRLLNPSAVRATANGYYTQEVTELIKCAEGDTLRVITAVSGSTKTVDIEGSDLMTTFSAKLLA